MRNDKRDSKRVANAKYSYMAHVCVSTTARQVRKARRDEEHHGWNLTYRFRLQRGATMSFCQRRRLEIVIFLGLRRRKWLKEPFVSLPMRLQQLSARRASSEVLWHKQLWVAIGGRELLV